MRGEARTQALAQVGKYSVTQLHPRQDGLYSAFTVEETGHRTRPGKEPSLHGI